MYIYLEAALEAHPICQWSVVLSIVSVLGRILEDEMSAECLTVPEKRMYQTSLRAIVAV